MSRSGLDNESAQRPTVSIVIPTYGHADYVLAAIDSCLAQTYPPLEVIVVNDGSPDDAAARLRPLADAGTIRYVEQANAGQAAARNRGLALARGDLITFLDDDDWLPPDKLAWQAAYLSKHPDVGAIAGLVTFVDERGQPFATGGAAGEVTFDALFATNRIASPGQAMLRRAVLEQVMGFDASLRHAEDWDLYFRLSRITRIVVDDRVALFHRKHAGNASRQNGAMLAGSMAVVRRHLAGLPAADRVRLLASARQFLWRYAGARECRALGGALRRAAVRAAVRHGRNALQLLADRPTNGRLGVQMAKGVVRGFLDGSPP